MTFNVKAVRKRKKRLACWVWDWHSTGSTSMGTVRCSLKGAFKVGNSWSQWRKLLLQSLHMPCTLPFRLCLEAGWAAARNSPFLPTRSYDKSSVICMCPPCHVPLAPHPLPLSTSESLVYLSGGVADGLGFIDYSQLVFPKGTLCFHLPVSIIAHWRTRSARLMI